MGCGEFNRCCSYKKKKNSIGVVGGILVFWDKSMLELLVLEVWNTQFPIVLRIVKTVLFG